MPPGHRGRARGAPARGCISITRPALTGGSEPQRSGGGEGHYLWGGGLPGPQGYRMGGPRVPRGLAIGGSDLVAESRMRRGHVRVHVHITVRALGRGAGAGLGLRWPRGPMATCAPRAEGLALGWCGPPRGAAFRRAGRQPPLSGPGL